MIAELNIPEHTPRTFQGRRRVFREPALGSLVAPPGPKEGRGQKAQGFRSHNLTRPGSRFHDQDSGRGDTCLSLHNNPLTPLLSHREITGVMTGQDFHILPRIFIDPLAFDPNSGEDRANGGGGGGAQTEGQLRLLDPGQAQLLAGLLPVTCCSQTALLVRCLGRLYHPP